MAREFLSPPWVARGDGTARTFVRIATDAPVDLTALRSGPGGRVVVRLASLMRHDAAEVRLHLHGGIRSATAVDLREGWGDVGNTGFDVIRTAAPLDVHADGTATARLAPYEIGTWTLELA
jgi:hypothetical protein